MGPVVSVDGVPFLMALTNAAATAEGARAQGEQIRKLYASMSAEQLAMQSKMALAAMISDPARIETVTRWAAASDGAATGAMVAEMMTTDLRPEVAHIKTRLLLVGAGKAFGPAADRLAAVQQAYEDQVKAAPHHDVVVDANALHFVMFDDLAFLLAKMDAFLGRTR